MWGCQAYRGVVRAYPKFIFLRLAITALLVNGLVFKLRSPGHFINALQKGFGLSSAPSYIVYVCVLVVLCVIIAALWVCLESGLGLWLAGGFFFAGACYLFTLRISGFSGDCGCGLPGNVSSYHPMLIRMVLNSTMGVVCLISGGVQVFERRKYAKYA